MAKYIVKLTKEERADLLTLIKNGKSAARKLEHARILLEVDKSNILCQNKTDSEVSNSLHVSEKTIHRIRERFVNEGLEKALERKVHARHKPCKIQGEEEARLIALCCSSAPEGRSRWTLSLLADKLVELNIVDEISCSTVGRALKKTN